MFKYRLLNRYKVPGPGLLKRFLKLTLTYCTPIAIIILIFLGLRESRLSSYEELGEARAEALNYALNRLTDVDEKADGWREPRVDGAAIFSAYLDTRPEVVLEEDPSLVINETAWAVIRIIGVVPVDLDPSTLTCHYRYRHKVAPSDTYTLSRKALSLRLVAFPENFGMAYSAAYVMCELPGRETPILPGEVSVTSGFEGEASMLRDWEFVAVRYPKSGWRPRGTRKEDEGHSVAVCVQPLHHEFDKLEELVEFIEFYRLMGVTRFTFYRDSCTPRVNQLLEFYQSEGVAVLIDWRLPQRYVFEANLRVDGIFAALNDCLYRSTSHHSYRYVAGVDIDEFIVPRLHDNLEELMASLNPTGSSGLFGVPEGAWIFRNMFFYLMHPDDEIKLPVGSPRLNLHSKTLRWKTVNPPRDRSKFIVQGRDVIELGNHRVWRMKRAWSVFGRRYREASVDPEVAGSQHYRKCETNVEKCWRRETTLDRTAHRFTGRLAARVAEAMRRAFPSTPGA